MNIQIISDVHLEFGNFELPDKNCDLLIAAGDIGVGVEGLEWLQTLNVPVVYVAGNHEYWGYEINNLSEKLQELSKGSNVHYLEKNSVIIDDVRFVGCTLWTNFNETENHNVMEELQCIMNDFRYIFFETGTVTPEQLIKINQDSKEWLVQELAKTHEGATVVVTHHAPCVNSWAADPDDYLKFAYCNELDSVLKENQIDLWVHGHIHHSNDYNRHGVRVVSNPRGYAGYQIVKNFDPGKTVSIK